MFTGRLFMVAPVLPLEGQNLNLAVLLTVDIHYRYVA